MEPINFIFINGKGSCGKDTQADLLVNSIGESAIKLSTGDIYRDARDNKGEYAKYHEAIMPFIDEVDKSGGYVSDEVICNIAKVVLLDKVTDGAETIVFTGFPRTIGQLQIMDELINSIEGSNSLHIHFDISDETVRERASMRRERDIREGKTARPDDDPETVEKRLNTYREKTYPMILKLDQEKRLISINGEASIPEIEKETSIRLSKER